MCEKHPYGSEGGAANARPYPYPKGRVRVREIRG